MNKPDTIHFFFYNDGAYLSDGYGNMGDVRKVAPNGGIRSLFAKFAIPAGGIQSGDKLALWLPDASATIADRAVYAIHLANYHDSDDTEWVTSNPGNPNDPSATGGYNVFYTFP